MSNDLGGVVRRATLGCVVMLALTSVTVAAQDPAPPAPQTCPCPPPEPTPVWTGSLAAGLALTQGNRDTTNFNLSFDVKRDPKTKTIFKAAALYIVATEDGEENVDRALANARVEYLLTDRTYVFGQVAYVRDRFKEIDWLLAPTGGLGYKIIDNDRTAFDVDGGVGMVFEKNTGFDTETDGAVMFGERLSHKLTPNATVTQGLAALWKMDDFDDALYTFSAGLAATVTTQIQLKVEFQDIYQTRPSGVDTDKNDIAFITAFVYKF